MRAEGTFKVQDFTPAAVAPTLTVKTGVDVGVATMEKSFDGGFAGRSATLFTAAFDQATGTGTYVAMESFEGSLNGVEGTFNFAHTASTTGSDRTDAHFLVVPGSGTAGLTGISGTGELTVDADGTHRVWIEYVLPQEASPGGSRTQ
ncbi:DUF3224 domain-containing protein [Actinocorallia longicatena]|uniref:DUF3224 domain-containing protein n=1 Tax=Actinocorallia longicatena TaxID=111803 RepID=A0ABP6QFB3_9ACTN